MERFNYPNLAAVLEEDAYIMYLLDCEQYGEAALEQREQEYELERRQAEMDAQARR